MIDPSRVSAVLVTRGNVDLTEILTSFTDAGLAEFIVWDNSRRPRDMAVFGRYEAIGEADGEVIYVQDDDCVLSRDQIRGVIAGYEPGAVTCNMTDRFRENYPDAALVGFGAVFDRDLPRRAFARFAVGRSSMLFLRTCDLVFTALTPRRFVDVGHRNLPWATDPDRMYRSAPLLAERKRMMEALREIT